MLCCPSVWRSAITPLRASAPGFLLVGLLSLYLPGVAVAQEMQHDHPEIGAVDFQVSCQPQAQRRFDHAVSLLHHMMYQEARQAFEEIIEDDPRCGMAHWGVAMTLFQPLWPARPDADARQQGWEAVQRAKQTGSLSERERSLVAAAEAFFQDPGEEAWWPRIRRWSQAMEQAHRRNPDDTETAVFYALSQIAAGPADGNQEELNARASEILREVHEREPAHPGAIHYTIHANDITTRAGESPEIVRAYDRIAPSVPHALHMPSHIYVRLGQWPEVMEWNRRSADAALQFQAGDRISLHYVHALDYMVYAHLQRGEDALAGAVLNELRSQNRRFQEDFASAYHLAVMPARHAVERRAWAEAAALEPLTPGYLSWASYPWPEAVSWFARGLGAVHTGDLATARDAERRMLELRDQARAADEQAFATFIDVDRLILSGRLAHADGDAEAAVGYLREAAALESTVQKHPVTPGAILPANEALGDLLLELQRPVEALQAYETSLQVWPNRFNSLLGAARSARAAGEPTITREHYTRLLEITEGAETDRPGIREARELGARRTERR